MSASDVRYRAFISYASTDRVLATRFQRSLEHYRIPKALRGIDRGLGPIPKYLTPLFRDRSDARVGDLGEVLRSALESSDALIVMCSPAAARSTWVNTEIRTFKAQRDHPTILAVLLSGEPRRAESEQDLTAAFPQALFETVDRRGQIIATDGPMPIAADIRPEGDGVEFAKLKVVSALTGVPLVELTDRQHEAEARERLIVRAVAVVMTMLALVATVAAFRAAASAADARRRLSNAIEIAARRVDEAARYGDAYGVDVEAVRDMLERAGKDFSELVGDDGATPELLVQRARLHSLFSRLYGTVRDPSDRSAGAQAGPTPGGAVPQVEEANRALRVLEQVPTRRSLAKPGTWFVTLVPEAEVEAERLAAIEALAQALSVGSKPEAPEVMAQLQKGRDLAQALGRPDFVARFWSLIGEQQYRAGGLSRAIAAFDQSLAALGHVIGARTDMSVERAQALSDRAELYLESERTAEALVDQAAAVAAFEALSTSEPKNTANQRRLAIALVRHGDTLYASSGCWNIDKFERAIAVLGDLHQRSPNRLDYAHDLSVALERLADAQLQSRDFSKARETIERLRDVRVDLYNRASDNLQLRRELAIAYERQSDLAMAEGKPRIALERLHEAREYLPAVRQGVDATDVDRVVIRDHAINTYKIGLAYRAAAEPAWRGAFQSALEGMKPLIERDDAPDGWLRDVAAFHVAFGDALHLSGERQASRLQWQAAIDLTERQFARHPNDPRLQLDREDLHLRLSRGRIPADRSACR